MKHVGGDGFLHCFLLGLFAAVLKGFELIHGAIEVAVEAHFEKVEIAESGFMAFRGNDFDHGGADFGNIELDDVIGKGLKMGHGEDVGFAGAGALQTPLRIANGLREHEFHGAERRELLIERFAKFDVAAGILIGEDDGLTGEPMANGVE